MGNEMPTPMNPLHVVDVAMVREVLLADTWHVLEPGSLQVIELQWMETQYEPGSYEERGVLQASMLGFRFIEGAPRGFDAADAAVFWPAGGVEVVGPLSAILAVKR